MERRRRTDDMIAGDREARSIAGTLGREVRSSRRKRRMRQVDLAAAVGLKQSRISAIERGVATGTPLLVWTRIGAALDRPLAVAFSRDIHPEPADAGHLNGQELLLRIARATGRAAAFELPTRPQSPAHSVDVCIRDEPTAR
jgi:transcriptional regulator with XRE-family HTH domain